MNLVRKSILNSILHATTTRMTVCSSLRSETLSSCFTGREHSNIFLFILLSYTFDILMITFIIRVLYLYTIYPDSSLLPHLFPLHSTLLPSFIYKSFVHFYLLVSFFFSLSSLLFSLPLFSFPSECILPAFE